MTFVIDPNFDSTQCLSIPNWHSFCRCSVFVESQLIIQMNTSVNAYLNWVNCRVYMHERQYFNLMIFRKYQNRNMDYGRINVDSHMSFLDAFFFSLYVPLLVCIINVIQKKAYTNNSWEKSLKETFAFETHVHVCKQLWMYI